MMSGMRLKSNFLGRCIPEHPKVSHRELKDFLMYTPREDSFLLQKAVKKYAKNKRVLDMGAGSGIQAQTALNAGAKNVLAVDIDQEVIKYLTKNHIQAIQSDLFSNIKKNEKFDLIVFNPPYLPEDLREDKESARITSGGKQGDEIIIRFLKQSLAHLAPEGSIFIVLSSITPKKKITHLIEKLKLSRKIIDKDNIFMETLEVWKISRKSKSS